MSTGTAVPSIDQMSESQRDEMLGKLVVDAFVRHGFGTIPVRLTDISVALLVPKFDPAVVSSIPDMPPEYVEEIKRRAATPEQAMPWSEFRELVVRDLRESGGG